jgi:hypothetical protein
VRRKEVLRAADADHRKCLTDAFAELVPSSAEGAETLATAVMARCLEHEKRRLWLLSTVFGLSCSIPNAHSRECSEI